jgi:DNA primase
MARDAVQEVRERTDIVELVQQYVPLKKAGRSYKGLCPFHQEKTPSFIVFPDSQNFHCFGCGKGGDVFSFYMGVERAEFREALQELAKRAGVQLDSVPTSTPELDSHRNRLVELNELAATFYANVLLNSSAGEVGRGLAEQRGLNEEMIRRFHLGFAPDSWDSLHRYFASRGVDPALANEAGLLQERETGGYYDRFRNRFIFPIRDREGRVVGFGGRAIGDAIPKYLNSPQSAIFDKSALLYALDIARDEIRKRDEVVIVEGYMDAIAAHQYGHANVVAAMGTALTESQIGLLKRFTKRIVLALDADAAGQMATIRGLESMQQALDHDEVPIPDAMGIIRFERRLNADISIVSLPEGKDPDELIRKSPERWPEIVAGAQPFIAFYIDTVTAETSDNDPRSKSAVIARVAPLLRQLPDRVVQAHYVDKLAARLRLDPRLVESEIRRASLTSISSKTLVATISPRPEAAPRLSAEDHLLALLLFHRSLCHDIIASVPPELIVDSRNQALLAIIADPTIPDLEPIQIIAGMDDAVADHAERLIDQLEGTPALLPGAVRKEAEIALDRVRRERLNFLKREVTADLQEAQKTGDSETAIALTLRLNELADGERTLYPPVSPYFRDSRTSATPTGTRPRQTP